MFCKTFRSPADLRKPPGNLIKVAELPPLDVQPVNPVQTGERDVGGVKRR
jgi:hypothetical protein